MKDMDKTLVKFTIMFGFTMCLMVFSCNVDLVRSKEESQTRLRYYMSICGDANYTVDYNTKMIFCHTNQTHHKTDYKRLYPN